MKVTITTLSGVEAAHLDVDAALQLGDVLALLPSQAGGTECPRRLLMGSMRLSDIGVKEGSTLTLVCVGRSRVLPKTGLRKYGRQSPESACSH